MTDGRARDEQALLSVIDETRLLFHRLKATAETLHRQGQTSAGRRGVLLSLRHKGPQTVPQLARARPVSRQHIQMLVNPLADEGLVELVDNPKHKRSKLVQLTRQGRLAVEEIERRERPVLEALTEWLGDSGLDVPDLEQAAAVLEAMRERLADKHVLDLLKGEQA